MSIAMSVERYADTAAEFIGTVSYLRREQKTPRLRIQGWGVLFASVICPSFSKTDNFNRICPPAPSHVSERGKENIWIGVFECRC